MIQQPTIRRILRDFTPEERANYNRLVAEIDAEKAEIIATGREFRVRNEVILSKIRTLIQTLVAERKQQGKNLDDIEKCSGLDRGVLERLENETEVSVPLSTLVQYADALGKNLSILLSDK